MPILPDDDAMYFVMGGTQIDPSIYRTKLGTGVKSEDEHEGAKNTEQQVQADSSSTLNSLTQCYIDTTQETINRFLTSCKRRKNWK